MNKHVHIDRPWVERFGPQEVEDGGEQRRIPVNEDLYGERRGVEVKTRHIILRTVAFKTESEPTAPVSSFRVEIRPLRRLKAETHNTGWPTFNHGYLLFTSHDNVKTFHPK